nr:hypothetical protein [uncultured Ruminococcus sp.]
MYLQYCSRNIPGLLYGLADCLQSCKMNNCINLLLAKDLLQRFTIQNVCLIKGTFLPVMASTLGITFSLALQRLSNTTTS